MTSGERASQLRSFSFRRRESLTVPNGRPVSFYLSSEDFGEPYLPSCTSSFVSAFNDVPFDEESHEEAVAENENRYRENIFSQICKPVLWSMHLTGSCPVPYNWWNNTSSMLRALSFFYCIIIIIMLFLFLTKGVVALIETADPFFSGTFYVVRNLIGTGWIAQCFCNVLILSLAARKNSYLNTFLRYWKENLNHPTLDCFLGESDVKALCCSARFYLATAWTFALFNIGVRIFATFGPLSYAREDSMRDTEPFNPTIPLQLLLLVGCGFASFAWVHPIVFFVVVSSILSRQFRKITKKLVFITERRISLKKQTHWALFEKLRVQHQLLSRAVAIADREFRKLIFACYITNIPLISVLTYRLFLAIWRDPGLDGFSVFIHVFWLTGNSINFIIVSMAAAGLHDAASFTFKYSL